MIKVKSIIVETMAANKSKYFNVGLFIVSFTVLCLIGLSLGLVHSSVKKSHFRHNINKLSGPLEALGRISGPLSSKILSSSSPPKPKIDAKGLSAEQVNAVPYAMLQNETDVMLRGLGDPAVAKDNRCCLFSVAVGGEQAGIVNEVVSAFIKADFAIMIFHYELNLQPYEVFPWFSSGSLR